ncbi:HelD family protein [Peterkaempfera sp. SMS 1(5)a]|uniref:HelD family protein n=1 Tax=Peterkaempfera podocarpi TaxID=3232308 RepID=UPI00366F99CD
MPSSLPPAPEKSELEKSELDLEQARLDVLYQRMDLRRQQAAAELAAALRDSGGTAQARLERGVAVHRLSSEVARYDAVEQGLCFGRVDLLDGTRRYLGRIGLRAADAEAEPLLIDWRAPAARPFYTATAAAPQGLRLRRNLRTRDRRVTQVDDEWLDGAAPDPGEVRLVGEAALLAALGAERTGRMRTAVATLQTEQDRIIRAPRTGVLVVQGGPGTGKTVVALHRAAYLLYTHPRLDERGVLVVGPNPVFLRYISQVLPGLGETGVLLSTVGELLPGLVADRRDPAPVAEIKGRLVMAEVLDTAVRQRQAAGDGPVEAAVGGERLLLEREFLERAVAQATAGRLPHNLARPLFRRAVVGELARRLAGVIAELEDRIEADLAGRIDTAALDRAAAEDLAGLFGDGEPETDREAEASEEFAEAQAHWLEALPRDPAVRRLLDRLWPALTPYRLLEELFADPDRLAAAAPQLTPAERGLLLRRAGSGWTESDVPLLDEAAELLGHDDRAAELRRARERAEEIEYAQGVLDIARGSRSLGDEDPDRAEQLGGADVVGAEQLAGRHQQADLRTVAERAAADRTWVFGHVIVDEAQELSPMAWRLLVRRCPTRSFTVVGDIAQTGEAAGPASWAEALTPFFGDRWRLERLTVNYRTPAEIIAASDPVLAAIRPESEPARAVRSSGVAPRCEQVRRAAFPARLAALAAEEAAQTGAGRLAVIVPEAGLPRLAEAVRTTVPEAVWGAEPDLERPVAVLTPRQAKGLEFDSVLLADPAAVLAASPRGLNDLYVALTRSSRRLTVLLPGPAPELLAHLLPTP